MPDISPRFSLTVPSQPDPFVTVEIADNWEALDEKVSGYVLGTIANRPSPSFANRGFFYFETDTSRMSFSTGSQWIAVRDVSSVFGFAVMVFDNESARNAALSGVLVEGMLAYLKNIKRVTRYDGTQWKVEASDASDLTTGTLPVGRGVTAGSADAGVPKYNGTTQAAGMFYGGTNAPSDTTRLNYDGNLHATGFTGSGSGLTAVPAEQLTGTIDNQRIPVITRKSFATNNNATLTLDFATGDEIVRSNRDGTLAVAGTNYTAGITKTVLWNGGATNRGISFPAGWVFVGNVRPTLLAANKRGALTVTCHGATEAECTAAWSAEL